MYLDPDLCHLEEVDQDLYAALLKQRLPQIEANANTVYDLEKAVTSVNYVLVKCTDDAAPRQQHRARKAKLRAWTPVIKAAVTVKKDASYCWKVAGRPQDGGNHLLIQKRLTTKVLRQLFRKENAQQYINDKREIIGAKTYLLHYSIN